MRLLDRRRPPSVEHTVEPGDGRAVLGPKASRLTRWLVRRATLVEWTAVTAGSTLIGAVVTWPLVRHPSGGVYGFGNDKFGGIWNSDWIHETAFGPGAASFSEKIQYPFGVELDERFVQPLDRLLAIALGGIGDGIFVNNLQTLLSFTIAGPAMYALARYLTGSRAASAVAAVVFIASPFHLGMAMQYPSLATIQWAPLVVLTALMTLERQRLRDAAFFGASLALTWLSSYYYGWFSLLFLLPVLLLAAVLGLIRAGLQRRVRSGVVDGARFVLTRGAVAVGVFMLISLPFLIRLALRVGGDTETYSRSLEDLSQAGVKPWQYVLPPHDNPVLGDYTRDFVQQHTGILPVYEQSVYLGVVPVLLAAIAIIGLRRATPAARRAAPLLIVGALFMVLLSFGASLPLEPFSTRAWLDLTSVSTVQNVTVPLFELVPIFRYYGRTFIFTSVCLACFAAVGIQLLESRFGARFRHVGVGLAAVAIPLVLFEFNNLPPFRWTELPREPWMRTLEQTPAGAAVVDYPLSGFYEPRSYYYLLTQAQHGRPTLNYAETDEAKELSFAVSDPDNPESGRRLSQAGFRYAVVHTQLPPQTMPPYQPALPDDSLSPNAGAANPWFVRAATVRNAVVYRIRSRPGAARPSVASGYGHGFGAEETDGIERWRWIHGSSGTLHVHVGGRPRWFSLSFKAASFDRPRVLVVSVDGRQVRRVLIGSDSLSEVVVPLALGQGAHDISLRASPEAVTINDVLHNGDLRTVSLRISPPEIRESAVGAGGGFGPGFHSAEPGSDWRWLRGRKGGLILSVSGVRQRLAVSFEAMSFAKTRRLSVSVDGRLRRRLTLPAESPRQVALALALAPGTHTIGLTADSGAVVADSVLGNGDRRAISVRIRQPVVQKLRAGALVSYGPGFDAEERVKGRTSRWMTARSGLLHVEVVGRGRQFRLLMRANAFDHPRRLDVVTAGQRVASAIVPPGRFREISVPLRLGAGSHVLRLRTPSRPTVVDSVLHNGDRRAVTVRLQKPLLQEAGTGAVTSPDEGAAVFDRRFGIPEQYSGGIWRWLNAREGTASFTTVGPRRSYIIGFAAASFYDVRALRVTVDGRMSLRADVPANKPQDFQIPVKLTAGTHVIRFSVTPGAERIDDRLHNSDSRSVSIFVRTPSIEPLETVIDAPFTSTGYGYGFAPPLAEDPVGWRWLSEKQGTLIATVTGPKRRLWLSFQAQSFQDRVRRLTVQAGGRTILSRRVSSTRPMKIAFPLVLGAGTHTVFLRVEPGPVFRGPLVFQPDPRKVSLRIRTPTLSATRTP